MVAGPALSHDMSSPVGVQAGVGQQGSAAEAAGRRDLKNTQVKGQCGVGRCACVGVVSGGDHGTGVSPTQGLRCSPTLDPDGATPVA